MTIRKATVKDLDVLIDITHKIMLDGEAAGFPAVIAPTKQNASLLCSMMVHPGIVAGDPVLLAEENGVVIGAVVVLIRRGAITLTKPSAYSNGWWIEPAFRNRGIISQLLDEAERLLRTEGIVIWEEFISIGNSIPESVAEKRGFKCAMRIWHKNLT